MNNNILSRRRILIWVDDVPTNNTSIVQEAKLKGIALHEFVTTKQAIEFISKSLSELSGSAVRIITDMFRIEEGKEVPFAGEELIRALFFKGYNYPLFCFTSSDSNIARLKESYPHILCDKTTDACKKFAFFETDEKALLELEFQFQSLYKELKDQVNAPIITLVDKKTLVNPLKDSSWENSPLHKVIIKSTKEEVTLFGWETQGYQDKTGKLLTKSSSETYKVIDKNDIEISNKTSNPPWFHREIKIWKSDAVSKIFKDIFKNKIEGLDCTFKEVFDGILREKICVFIVGGAIRDCIIGKDKKEINDIDMGFGCTANEIEAIARKNSWWKSNCFISPFGRVQLGDSSKILFLEGKSINGFNNDRIKIPNLPSSIGTDLFAENMYRDFSCNALWYDPFNEVIIDPTGHGVEDSLKMILRIPVDKDFWDKWIEGNPLKLYRYWKFRARGYKPADQDTKNFFCSKAFEIAKKWKKNDCKIMLLNGVIGGKQDSVAKSKAKYFRDCLNEDLTNSFYDTYFLPFQIN